jgi:UDP-glucose 4-epimerase
MPQKYSRALVTGGAGFIGSHLARSLMKEGIEVVILDDLSMGTRAKIPPQCEFIEGSICDPATVAKALTAVDIVFHNAARVSVRASVEQFVEDAQTNVFGTLVLLRALAGTSVTKFVIASSMAVYADSQTPQPINEDFTQRPLSPYGTGKLAAELYALQICGSLGIDVVPLRYFNTYGPGQTFTAYVGVVTIFATKLLRGERPTIFGDGRQVRDFVSVHDIVQGNLCAMRSSVTGKVFNIGSGVGMSVNEVAELLVAKISPKLMPIYAMAQPGETRNSVADIARAHELLGYQPAHSFRAEVDEVIAAVRMQFN